MSLVLALTVGLLTPVPQGLEQRLADLELASTSSLAAAVLKLEAKLDLMTQDRDEWTRSTWQQFDNAVHWERRYTGEVAEHARTKRDLANTQNALINQAPPPPPSEPANLPDFDFLGLGVPTYVWVIGGALAGAGAASLVAITVTGAD